MSSTSACAKCGADFKSAAQPGFCPACLFEFGLTEEGSNPAAPTGHPGESVFYRFGDYELIKQIAQGGMGIIYKARQVTLNRLVAVKMILTGQLASPEEIKRFRLEARAAANLHHPNIIPIYEVGEHGGRHYFSMRLVEGPSLGACQAQFQVPQAAARLVATLARAIHFAHEQGILHRDLKPSNILIDSGQEPLITDFGIAKLLHGETADTLTQAMIGTPAYMPPEQVTAGDLKLSAAADVYSLGAILYELLSGRPPFRASNVVECIRMVVENEPPRLREVALNIPSDLETICLKCLEKYPGKRYPTAEALAKDLEAWLRGDAISARPPGSLEQTLRWSRRRPGLAVAAASILVGGALILATTLAYNLQLKRKETQLAATVNRLEMQGAETLLEQAEPEAALAHLAAVVRREPKDYAAAERTIAALSQTAIPLPDLLALQAGLPSGVVAIDGLPARHALLIATGKNLELRDARDWHLLGRSLSLTNSITAMSSNPAEDLVAMAMGQGGLMVFQIQSARPGGECQFQPLAGFTGWESAVFKSLQFSPQGHLLATGSSKGEVVLWSTETGQVQQRISAPGKALRIRFAPSGKLLAVSNSGKIRIFDTNTGETVSNELTGEGTIFTLDFSPDSQKLLSCDMEGGRVWSMDNLAAPPKVFQYLGQLRAAQFSNDGRTVAINAWEQTVSLWDMATGQAVTKSPLRHDGWIESIAFSADGKTLLTACLDQKARLWPIPELPGREQEGQLAAPKMLPAYQPQRESTALHHAGLKRALFLENDTKFVTLSEEGGLAVWKRPSNAFAPKVLTHPFAIHDAAFSPNGAFAATGDSRGWLSLWDGRSGKLLHTGKPHQKTIHSLRFDQSSTRLATGSSDNFLMLWDLDSLRLIGSPTQDSVTNRLSSPLVIKHPHTIHSVQFSPDGQWLLTACEDHKAYLWNATNGTMRFPPVKHKHWIRGAEFSPDGKLFSTASEDHTARVWDSTTGQPVTPPLEHQDIVVCAFFSPDGKKLVTGSADHTARLWDVATGQPIGGPLHHEGNVDWVTFSPDLSRVATASQDKSIRLWDSRSGNLLAEPLRHPDRAYRVEFSPDGQRLLTAAWDGSVRVWDGWNGQPLSGWMRHHRMATAAHFNHDLSGILSASEDSTAGLWPWFPVQTPAPDWLPDLAEVLGGYRLNSQGVLDHVSREKLVDVVRKIASASAKDLYAQWARTLLQLERTTP